MLRNQNNNDYPFFAFALRCNKLFSYLDKQTFKDFKVVCYDDEVSQGQDLSVFQKTPSAYYFISLCPDYIAALFKNEKFLLQLMVSLKYHQTDLYLFTVGPEDHKVCVGFVLNAATILHAPDIPKSTSGLVIDLIEYVKSLGGKIQYKGLNGPVLEGGVALQKQGRVLGYRKGPIKNIIESRKAINKEPKTDIVLRQCGTNELYGHAQILRDYCGISERLPIRGRLMHGWQAGSGIIYDDLTHLAPSYVWNKRNHDCIKDMSEVYAIGAPYLYMKEVMDPGPIGNSLLAIPIHSLIKNKVDTSWEDFARAAVEFAELKGMSSITAMLYCLDFRDEIIDIFSSYGINCVSSAEQGDVNFLYRARSIIRQHSTVICNRISTALFYSLFELRPTYIWGPKMKTMPRDAYEEVCDDMDWVKHYFPTILKGGLEGVEAAKLELGTACKKAPDELKSLLYGWLA